MKRLEERVVCCVDLENPCGGSGNVAKYEAKVKEIVYGFDAATPHLVYVSTGPTALASSDLLFAWSEARYLPGHGLDGADRALCRTVLDEAVTRRSRRVLLVSGDHYFASSVERLRANGVNVTVMAQADHLNAELAALASEVILLPHFDNDDELAAWETTWKAAA